MPLLSLDLQEQPAIPSRQQALISPFPFSFNCVGVMKGFFPGRGLLYSFLFHEVVVFGTLWLPVSYDPTQQPPRPQLIQMIDLREARQVLYLPQLEGGSEGSGHAGRRSGAARKGSPGTPAHATKGFSYPGPQPILSDPPKPTNRIQTILQSGLVNPPESKPLIPLPNMVQMANSGPAPVPQVELVKLPRTEPAEFQHSAPPNVRPEPKVTVPNLPTFKAEIVPPMEVPKLTLPTSVSQDPFLQAEAKPPEPVTKPGEQPPEPRAPPQFSPLPTSGKDLHNLLVLSPMPAPPEKSLNIPTGEARGLFAISPEPDLTTVNPGSGSKLEPLPSSATGSGNQIEAPIENAAAKIEAGAGTGGAKGAGAGPFGSAFSGSTVERVAGPGMADGKGAGTGHGPDIGAGHGPGAGVGPDGGVFPGITIQGGRLETGAAARSHHTGTPAPPQRSYGLTIVSTSNSGGGLADLGVFHNEQVYTVYLDARRTVEDPGPSWTLQYAALPSAAAPESAAKSSSRSQEGLVPPFPVNKELPQWPVELAQKYWHRLIVVYAIIDTAGKLVQMSVKQSPNAQLNKPLLEALCKWVFRPAELDGNPVAVKALLGIPLSLPD